MKTAFLKTPLLAGLGAAMIAGLTMSDASAFTKRDGNSAYEQRIKLKTEWKQARNAGGYSNPISAFVAWISGEDLGSDIQPVVNDPHSRKDEALLNYQGQ